MTRLSIVSSAILITSFALSGGLGRTMHGQDRTKSPGTVDADRDRAGKTGQIGDADRGGPTKISGGHDGSGAFRLRQFDLNKDGRISKNEYDQAFTEWIRTAMVICHLRNSTD
jgi:hypothetical protein